MCKILRNLSDTEILFLKENLLDLWNGSDNKIVSFCTFEKNLLTMRHQKKHQTKRKYFYEATQRKKNIMSTVIIVESDRQLLDGLVLPSLWSGLPSPCVWKDTYLFLHHEEVFLVCSDAFVKLASLNCCPTVWSCRKTEEEEEER